jgi:CRISPR-associated protein Cst2
MNKKAISAIWLSETSLTNLNSGVGGSNLVDLKKYKKDGVDYPYVSGQAMRFYLKESIRRLVSAQEYCVANEKGETCGNITECILCDLFGFMTTLKDQGAQIRVSPIKMSPAMGLLPLNDNMTIDFLTRRKPQESAGELKGDIVNVELAVNIYRAGLSIDLAKIGAEELIENKKMVIKDKVPSDDIKKLRVKTALEAFKNVSDYSKQARLLTDFTPNLILIAIQDRYNHTLQKALELEDSRNINIDRLDQVLRSLKGDKIYAGLLSGTLGNEEDLKQVLKKHGIELKTPNEAIDTVIAEVD